jgi:UDP:flavonoid glycosyltransferase YjiC (YdhE family)
MFAASYVPYSEIMPKSAATVHQGGIGTTAQALRAGRPMLVVPWAHDQPDNAERLCKLGVGRSVPRARYTADRAARELSALLNNDSYCNQALEIGAKVVAEDGTADACRVIEEFAY